MLERKLEHLKHRKFKLSCFVFDVPVRDLLSSMTIFVPCDPQLQMVHYNAPLRDKLFYLLYHLLTEAFAILLDDFSVTVTAIQEKNKVVIMQVSSPLWSSHPCSLFPVPFPVPCSFLCSLFPVPFLFLFFIRVTLHKGLSHPCSVGTGSPVFDGRASSLQGRQNFQEQGVF